MAKHPMQPIEYVDGIIRFKANRIVAHLVDNGSIDLNAIARMAARGEAGFTQEDQEQLAQLLGYSVSGFGDLPYASEETVAAADEIAAQLYAERQGQS